jgi:ABC-type uncharacterized transport system auxiliary subunit
MRITAPRSVSAPRRVSLAAVVGLLALAVLSVACGSPQQIRHYQPQVATQQVASANKPPSEVILAVEDFSAGTAYDEQRIVYRADAYKFDYYHFHRWAAPAGQLVSDALREVYRDTGAFKAVVSSYATRADVVLSGRVIALEEVDKSKKEWLGRVHLGLRLRDAKTGELLWSETLRIDEPMKEQDPDGLAAAVSRALTSVGLDTTDTIVEYGKDSVRQSTSQPAGGQSPFQREMKKQQEMEETE